VKNIQCFFSHKKSGLRRLKGGGITLIESLYRGARLDQTSLQLHAALWNRFILLDISH